MLQKLAVLLVLALLGTYAATSFRGPNGYAALQEKRRQIRELQEENANLMREIEMKRARIERLRVSAAEQENEIRRRLKLLKPGEKTFILPEEEPTEEPAAPVEK
jgi:cell division protein FtsB